MSEFHLADRDRPWVMRTYAGHSSAAASNALFRRNLAKGQTGLSVAFDLPTQTGYDADHALARGEVGRDGVPVGHLGDMRALFDQIPLERTNTSMTINAPAARLGEVVGRISFFVNAGVRFVEEMCKLRAFARLWDEITRERYGIEDPALRRFRYGVQVNSLGLTEAQPENNIQRIVLEMLGVTLSRNVRARAVQLPAWNEALGLPRPWDQQWSLRIQQVLAYESDLLEYGDLFEGSPAVEAKTAELVVGAEAEMAEVAELGGMVPAVESGYLKARLVGAHAARRARIESGQDRAVGVNRYAETEPNPLVDAGAAAIETVDPAV